MINVKRRVLPNKKPYNFLDVLKVLILMSFIGLSAYKILPLLNGSSASNNDKGIVFKNLSQKYQNIENSFDTILINKKENIEGTIIERPVTSESHNVFVIDYVGTITASEVKYLRSKVDAILLKANEDDEVVVKITSGGGSVNGYGLVSSQLKRLKTHGLKVTTVVDSIAASGGYMAAVVSDKIVAAPFSYVGSIGVVANVLIYEELLKRFGFQSNVYTAGESKRSVVPSRIPTKEEEEKLKKELADIHERFKEHVLSYRPLIDVDKVFTGQAFLAVDALKYGLVDKIGTSDELLLDLYKEGNRIIDVKYLAQDNFTQGISKEVSAGIFDAIKNEIFNTQSY